MGRWVLDLDGVVWRGEALIAGSDRAVQRLLQSGHEVLFCTNHAQSPAAKVAHLERLGVPICPVLTSGESVIARCDPTDQVLVLGDPTLAPLLVEHGLDAMDVFDCPDGSRMDRFEVVVVGATDRWDRSRIGMAADAVRTGARFLATNDDPTFPATGPFGARIMPGNGALVAAVATAAGTEAEVTGKPHAAMAELILDRHGPVDVVVGDKPETDGALAVRLGAHFGLVLSGVTSNVEPGMHPEPWIVGADLADLVDRSVAAHA